MKLKRIKDIVSEEVSSILEADITKNFTKAVEALQTIQLKQQNLRKAFVSEKDPKKKEKFKSDLIKIHKVVQKAELEFNQAIKSEPIDYNESKLNEDVWKNFIVDLDGGGKLLKATNTDNRKTVKARSTSKVWDDGVPVLKYIARASKKDSPLPKGKFKVAHDTNHGWWYYQLGKTWYGIDTKDYSTPPFEY